MRIALLLKEFDEGVFELGFGEFYGRSEIEIQLSEGVQTWSVTCF